MHHRRLPEKSSRSRSTGRLRQHESLCFPDPATPIHRTFGGTCRLFGSVGLDAIVRVWKDSRSPPPPPPHASCLALLLCLVLPAETRPPALHVRRDPHAVKNTCGTKAIWVYALQPCLGRINHLAPRKLEFGLFSSLASLLSSPPRSPSAPSQTKPHPPITIVCAQGCHHRTSFRGGNRRHFRFIPF